MMSVGADVLAVPMDPDTNDAGASSVREYLVALARQVWIEDEGFSGKRPFGNSDWADELFDALATAGLIQSSRDRWGELFPDRHAGDQLIRLALDELARSPVL